LTASVWSLGGGPTEQLESADSPRAVFDAGATIVINILWGMTMAIASSVRFAYRHFKIVADAPTALVWLANPSLFIAVPPTVSPATKRAINDISFNMAQSPSHHIT
jgi:hypothetical protein